MRLHFPFATYGLIAASVIILMAVMSWAAQRGRPAARAGGRTLVFRYNFVFRWFALFAAFGVPAGITMLVVTFRPRGDDVWYVFAIYALFASVGLPLFWETSRYYVRVTPTEIERRSAWSGVRTLAWDEIREVTYSSFNAWFAFVAESGETIRVHGLISGMSELLRYVESRLSPATLAKARAGYERFNRPLPKLGNEPVLEARPPRR